MRLWPFIEVEEAEQRNVKRACELLEVSRAAYYSQRDHVRSRRAVDDAELTKRITAIHASSNKTYGAPRIHAQLRREGICCGRKRVARLMVAAGLAGRCPRRWRRTTIADTTAESRAVDLIKRVFGPDTKLDARWCGDVTYIRTWEGWAYLATVIDLASRRVVGWALADQMRTDLVADALRMACIQRRPRTGVIFHSDRGCQYTSGDFAALAAELGVTLSLGRKGQCWDNAVSESWFASFKGELIDTRPWPTLAGLRPAVFDYIEGWYNTRRLHSSLGYRSPAEYEATIHQESAARAA
ncbi:MAG: IS3 family transposase [Actinomycetota bacterium]|nr:IS3 family transposase [Actinomycetota bacterium]